MAAHATSVSHAAATLNPRGGMIFSPYPESFLRSGVSVAEALARASYKDIVYYVTYRVSVIMHTRSLPFHIGFSIQRALH